MSWLIIFLFYVVNTIFSYATHKNGSDFYEDRIKNNKTTPKVFDIGHKYLPDMSDSVLLPALLNGMVVLGPIFVDLVLDYKITNEFIYYFIIIMFIRMIMMNVTILPKNKKCNQEFSFISSFNGHCYDKIFSGHFASTFLLVLILYNRKITTNPLILGGLATSNALLILLTRSHYTIDILVSAIVVLFVYLNVPRIL
jgi:hypothetical protein